MANTIEAVSVKNPYGIDDTCSHIKTESKSVLVISDCMPYISTYAYQFWIRSTTAHTISFSCDTTYKRFDVTKEWQYFSIIFDVSKISNIKLEFPKGQYWVYNMKLEIGSYLTDWSPHPEDGISAYEDKFNNIEKILAQHNSTIQSTISLVDKANQEISNSVSKTTFESEILGVEQSISERFTNIEDGYNKWYVSIYDKSEFKDTNLSEFKDSEEDIDDRERYNMEVFAGDNANINPIDEKLVDDKPAPMRINAKGKILYYLTYARFSKQTTMTISCSHNKGTIYLNGLPIFSSDKLGSDTIMFDFAEGINIIEMVSNEGNFSFGKNISADENCILFNCLMGTPTQRTVKIREQGAYLNIYLDKIVSEVFDVITTESQDSDGVKKTVKSLRSKILQNASMIQFAVQQIDTELEDGTVESSFTIRPEAVEAITPQLIIKGVSGTSDSMTVIQGGRIQANSLSTDMLATNAIKSLNYKAFDYIDGANETPVSSDTEDDNFVTKWSKAGTFLDLVNGNFYSPSLYINSETNEAWFRGTIYATDGEFTGTIHATSGTFYGEFVSNSAILGPWHVNEHGIYIGDKEFASGNSGTIYMGSQGISLGSQLVYSSDGDSLRLNVDALSITGKSLYDIVLDNGNRMYYSTAVPTLTNYPSSGWNDLDTYADHVNDMCVDTSTGKVYQFKRKTAANNYVIKFSDNTYTRPSDYVQIYYLYNRTIHRVLRKIIGEEHSDIVIPSENFYVYWHTSSGASGIENYWGFEIEDVQVATAGTKLTLSLSGQNLPGYAVDASLSAGEYPESEHPYQSVDADKIWFCKIVSEEQETEYYEWVEVENEELKNTTQLANNTQQQLNNFLTTDWLTVDEKVETFIQETDPSKNYDEQTGEIIGDKWDSEEKIKHKGDIWYDGNIYHMYNGVSWDEMKAEPPAAVMDKIDGKAQVFVTQPTPPYYKNDLYFTGTEILVCIADSDTDRYDPNDWVRKDGYTDDTGLINWIEDTYTANLNAIKGQLDGKIQTWHQATNPATTWSADEQSIHEGDIWYDTTSEKTYRYPGTGIIWTEMKSDPPQSVFDTIDGKASIFVGDTFTDGDNTFNSPIGAQENDLWFKSENDPIMTYVKTSQNTYEWKEYNKYTDDTVANEANNNAKKALSYLHYDTTNGLILYDGTTYKNGVLVNEPLPDSVLTAEQLNTLLKKSNIRLSSSSLDIYYGNQKLASYGSTTNFYKTDGTTAATLGSDGFTLSQGSISLGPSNSPNFVVNTSGSLTAKLATIGGIHVQNDSIYSGEHTTYDSTVNGFYLGSNGYFGVGNNNSYIRFYKDTNDNNKWKLAVSVDSLSIGSNSVATQNYADTKASTAQTNAQTYADGKASSTLTSAQTYADGKAADAAKTATNYLYYDSTNGVVIHSTQTSLTSSSLSNLTSPYIKLLSTGMQIWNNKKLLVEYGSTTNFYDGNGTATSNIVASYGANGFSVSKGTIGGININDSGIYTGTKSSFSSTANGFFIGSNGSINFQTGAHSYLKVDSTDGVQISTNNFMLSTPITQLTDNAGVTYDLSTGEVISNLNLLNWIKDIANRTSLFHLDEYGLHIADRNNISYHRKHAQSSSNLGEEDTFDVSPYPKNILLTFDLYNQVLGICGYIAAYDEMKNYGGLAFGNRYHGYNEYNELIIKDLNAMYVYAYNENNRVESMLGFYDQVHLSCYSYDIRYREDSNASEGPVDFLTANVLNKTIYIGEQYGVSDYYYYPYETVGFRCKNIYKYTSGNTTSISDINWKKDIQDIVNAKDFILNIQPKKFKFKDGTSDRFHTGFIAQQVQNVMNDTIGDSGVFCNITFDNGETVCSLRYDEIIAPHVAVTQEHEREIQSLKNEVADLKNQIRILLDKLGEK